MRLVIDSKNHTAFYKIQPPEVIGFNFYTLLGEYIGFYECGASLPKANYEIVLKLNGEIKVLNRKQNLYQDEKGKYFIEDI